MTQLFIHPQVEDYFVEYDLRDLGSGQAFRQRIVDDYHGEKLILLRNLRLDADLSFLRSVTFYQKWKWKKLALSSFESISSAARRDVPEINEFVADVFKGDWGRFDYFIEQAKRINDTMRSTLNAIFEGYSFTRRDVIWRFTETRVENLHFDVDRNCDNLELIRMYANLDEIPRIWYTAGTFTRTGREWYDKLDLGRFRGLPHDKIVKELSSRIYGDWHSRGRDTVPRHLVMFEPGDVWLSDGRLMAHQVVYGRRVVSTLFVAPLSGVPNTGKTFAQKVADLLDRKDLPADSRERASTTAGLKKRPLEQNGSLDLSTAWESLPEHVRSGTLVRL